MDGHRSTVQCFARCPVYVHADVALKNFLICSCEILSSLGSALTPLNLKSNNIKDEAYLLLFEFEDTILTQIMGTKSMLLN